MGRYERLAGRVVFAVEALRQEIQYRLGQSTGDAATRRLQKLDVPCAPMRSAAEVMADAQFYQRGTLGPMRHAKLEQPVDGRIPGLPVVLSSGPLPELSGTATLGMQHHEILGMLLGLSDEQLRRLQEKRVV